MGVGDQRLPVIGAGVMLSALLAAYPANWLRLFGCRVTYPGSLEMFSLPLLALIAFAGLMLAPGRLILLWRRDRLSRLILVTFGLIALIQTILAWTGNWSFTQWGTTFFYLLLPMLGAAFAAEFRRCFPGFFTLLAVGGAALLIAEYLPGGRVPIGLTGNWNWNQTLLWISVPVALSYWPWKKRGLAIVVGSLAILSAGMFCFPNYWSRGTLVAAFSAWIISVLLWRLPSRKWRIAIGTGGVMAAVILFFAVLEFSTWAPDSYPAAGRLLRDTRIQLWRGGVQMVQVEGGLGVGAARTEFELPLHLPGDYYLSMYGSDRHPHPHNELLFYLGAFGILGGVAGIGLVIAALRGIRRAGKLDFCSRILGWGFLVLLLHGMVDVLLSEPLPGGVALLLAGAFWGYHLPPHQVAYGKLRFVAALVILLVGVTLAVTNLRSGMHLLRAQTARAQNDIELAEAELSRSIAIRPKPEALAFAARLALFDRKNPEAAIAFLQRLPELHIPHYSHSAQWMGRAYAASGNFGEALRWFDQEELYFPVSALTAGLRLMVLKQVKVSRADLLEAERDFHARLQLKGLTTDDFGLLLRCPEIDDNAADRIRILKREAANDAP